MCVWERESRREAGLQRWRRGRSSSSSRRRHGAVKGASARPKSPRAVRLVSPRERGQGWVQVDLWPWSPGGRLSSTCFRIDVYQDEVASTRATWDGEAAAWTGTIAAAMDEGGQKKRAIIRLGEAGGFTAASTFGRLARWGCGLIAKTSGCA